MAFSDQRLLYRFISAQSYPITVCAFKNHYYSYPYISHIQVFTFFTVITMGQLSVLSDGPYSVHVRKESYHLLTSRMRSHWTSFNSNTVSYSSIWIALTRFVLLHNWKSIQIIILKKNQLSAASCVCVCMLICAIMTSQWWHHGEVWHHSW